MITLLIGHELTADEDLNRKLEKMSNIVDFSSVNSQHKYKSALSWLKKPS